MSYRTKWILIVTLGLIGFYAVGLRETRGLTFGIAGHVTVAIGSGVYALASLVAVLALRPIERIENERAQFFLVLVACGVLAIALSGVRSTLSEDPLLKVVLDDLPKVALVVPLSWIVRKQNLPRKTANQSPDPTRFARGSS